MSLDTHPRATRARQPPRQQTTPPASAVQRAPGAQMQAQAQAQAQPALEVVAAAAVTPIKLLLTVREAAAALGVGQDKVYRLLGRHELRSVLIGASRRIPVRELEAYVERLLAESA